jgi:hypothetical protein
MGLQTWKNSPDGRIRKSDVTVAKNYLDDSELEQLNRIVTMYLDYAEDQASRQAPMTMANWASKLNAFLEFNGREVLDHAGKVTRAVADRLAVAEYEVFDANRKRIEASEPTSDFDKFVNDVKRIEPPKE